MERFNMTHSKWGRFAPLMEGLAFKGSMSGIDLPLSVRGVFMKAALSLYDPYGCFCDCKRQRSGGPC